MVRITEKAGEARHNLISHMRHKKDSRLTKRLSSNAQLVDIANHELELKKRIPEKVEEGDKRHEEHMKMSTKSMNSLTGAISNGFQILQGILGQNNAPQ